MQTVDPMFGPEDLQEIPTISDDEIVAQVVARYDRALDASENIRKVWNANYDAYNSEYDLGPKLKHQSQIRLPFVSRSVLYKAGRLKSALVSGTESFYAIQGQTEEAELVAPIHAALIDANLEAEDFPAKLEANAVAGQLTSGQAWVVYPDPDGGWPGYSRLEIVDQRTLLRDPTGRGKYRVQCRLLDASDLESMARARGWDPERVRQVTAVNASKDSKLHDAIERASRMLTMDADDPKRKVSMLYEYWGPLHRNDGTQESPMSYVVIGNHNVLLHRQDDPHGDGRDVYIDSDLLPNPFGVYAKTDVEDGVGQATALNRLLNAMIDGAAYDVHRVFLADLSRVKNAADLADGLAPGLVVDQDGDPSNPSIAPLNVGHLPQELFVLYQALKQEYEASTEVTDMTRGLPQSRGTRDQTATEFMGKTEAASRAMDSLAKSVEEKVLEPLLQRLVYYQGLYTDLDAPRIQRLCESEIENAVEGFVERYAERGQRLDPETARLLVRQAMAEPYTVRVRGISGVLAQDGQIAKLGAFLEAAEKLEMGPALDRFALMQRFAHLTGTDPKDALLDDAEQQTIQQQAQMMARQMAGLMFQQYLQQMTAGPQNATAANPQEEMNP